MVESATPTSVKVEQLHRRGLSCFSRSWDVHERKYLLQHGLHVLLWGVPRPCKHRVLRLLVFVVNVFVVIVFVVIVWKLQWRLRR